MNHIDTSRMYRTQWIAYYKSGLLGPRVVYGESTDEARLNALAEYRKAKTAIDTWPVDKVVDRVEIVLEDTDTKL